MELKEHLLVPKWNFDSVLWGFTTPYFGNQALTRKCLTNGRNMEETRNQLLRAIQIRDTQIFAMHQVHGDNVIWVTAEMAGFGSYNLQNAMEGDASYTTENDILLIVTWADCTPILLFDPVKKIAGAIHGGWKSTDQNIVSKMLKLFEESGSLRENIYAAIGPSIRDCCYQVGDDFQKRFSHHVSKKNGSTWFDLSGYHYEELIRAGIPKEQIDFYGKCTSCNTNPLFFSCRKDGKDLFEGQAAFICLKSKNN